MIAIHQSQFLPWPPYFSKLAKSEVFVCLDDVQFQKNGFQNRTLIKTPQGQQWLTVPVSRGLDTPINDVRVSDPRVYAKLLRTIEMNYARSRHFEAVFGGLVEVSNSKPSMLHDLNMMLMRKALDAINLKRGMVFSSALQSGLAKDDLVIDLVKKCGGSEYLSGPGGLGYMDLSKFRQEGIKVYIQEFRHVEYKQMWNDKAGFLPGLSVLDLMFNCLEEALAYIVDNASLKRVA